MHDVQSVQVCSTILLSPWMMAKPIPATTPDLIIRYTPIPKHMGLTRGDEQTTDSPRLFALSTSLHLSP